jgi:hypothetical protein
MGQSTHYAPDGTWIACGLPSPGSRMQSACAGLRPATVDSVLTTKDIRLVNCKRCRKSPEFNRDRDALAIAQEQPKENR